jgi:ABC-2 type transport system permease protein
MALPALQREHSEVVPARLAPVMISVVPYRVGTTTALATAILCGYLIGFRFYRSAQYTIGFCLLVMLIGFTLCFVGDLSGMISKNPEAMTFILVLPAVILVMVSVGLQPADQFPGWLQPLCATNRRLSFCTCCARARVALGTRPLR